MKSLFDISQVLRGRLKAQKTTQERLGQSVGVARQTLTNILSGERDFKVGTLLAVADRLGLELVLVSKPMANSVAAGQTTDPIVETLVSRALDNLKVQFPKQTN